MKTKRQNILQIAAGLFRDKGYAATSMREIAEQVGVEAASLYNHIKSKEDILQTICFEVANEYIAAIEELDALDMPSKDKLRHLLRLHIRTTTQNVAFVSVANHDWKHLNEPYLSTFKSIRKTYESGFARILINGMESGEFRKINPKVAFYTLLSAVRWLESWYKEGRNINHEELENDITSLIMNGLESPQ